jgi:hypothetical protein
VRMAKCSYGCSPVVPSHEGLPFFEFKGEGSRKAEIQCKNCPYYETAHGKDHKQVCYNFVPHGAFEFDSYYCGCCGWD